MTCAPSVGMLRAWLTGRNYPGLLGFAPGTTPGISLMPGILPRGPRSAVGPGWLLSTTPTSARGAVKPLTRAAASRQKQRCRQDHKGSLFDDSGIAAGPARRRQSDEKR